MFQNHPIFTSSSSPRTIPLFIISIIIIVIILFIFITKLIKIKHKARSLPPGPTPLPLFGSTIQMLLNRPTFRWIHKLMHQFDTEILCIRLGQTHVIVVSSPHIACEFLKKHDTIFISRPDFMSSYLISDGYRTTIMSPFGDQWKKMRTIVSQHMISSHIHKWLQLRREEEAGHMLRYIYNQVDKQDTHEGGLVNIRILSRQFIGNMVRKMFFGKRFFGEGMEDGGPGEEETDYVAALFTIVKYLYAYCITDYLPWLRWKTDFDGHEKIMRKAIKTVRKYQDPLIDERIKMWNSGAQKEEDDVLDVLIKHEKGNLTPEDIKAQMVEVMIATIDNPSNAIEWTMGEMIKEPKILKRAVEELDHVVGQNRLVNEQDLPELNYIKACLRESFRLHPIDALNVPHVSIMDTTVCGYFIPKGSHVLLSRYGLGRNPNVWTDPLRFDPDRHLSGEVKKVFLSENELRFLSFSTGKRGCPGVMLGTTMTTLLLARMLQGFTWEVPGNESSVELDENLHDLFIANPLVAIAKPRLSKHLYP